MADSPRPRRRRVRKVAIAVVGVLLLYLVVTFVQVWRATSWEATRNADAVVVLGAAQYNGKPSPVLRARLEHSFELWRRGRAPKIVLTGSKRSGDRFTEAFAGFQYLRRKGVPEGDLVIVDTGTSTWESLAASGRVLRAKGIDDLILVSDPYHSLRLTGIAEELGLGTVQVSPTDAPSRASQLLRETAAVALGRAIGYRRVTRLFEG